MFSNLDSSDYQTFIKKAKKCKDITSTVKWKTWYWTMNMWVWNPDTIYYDIYIHTHTHPPKKKIDVHSIFLLMIKYLAAKNWVIKNPSYANYIHNTYELDIKKILEIHIFYQLGYKRIIAFNCFKTYLNIYTWSNFILINIIWFEKQDWFWWSPWLDAIWCFHKLYRLQIIVISNKCWKD